MSGRRRALETAGFLLLVMVSLAALTMRWLSHQPGLSAEQSESLVLAKSFVAGDGFRLTPVSSAIAGPHNLAWFATQVGLFKAGLEPALWLPRIALLCLLLALVLVSVRGPLVWRRQVRVEDALPAVGLSVTTALAEAAGQGSGSTVWVLALALVAVLVGRNLPTGAALPSGLLMGALCVLRPSAVWLLIASAPAWWLAAKVEGRRAWRETFAFIMAGGFIAAMVFGGRWVLLGDLPTDGLLPSNVGAAAVEEFLARQTRWFFAALCALMVASIWRRFHMRGGATLLAWVLMTVVLASWSQNPRTLFLGCVPLLAMVVSDGLSVAREATLDMSREKPLRVVAWSALFSTALLLALAAIESFTLGPIMQVAVAPLPRPEVSKEISSRSIQQPMVAWTDSAEAAALFPTARIVVVTALSPRVEDLLMSEGPPDIVDPRISLDGMPRLTEVVEKGPGDVFWLKGQTTDEDPRCPDGRMSLLSTDGDALLAQLQTDADEEQVARGLMRWRCALAALEVPRLPTMEHRRATADALSRRAESFEREGRLELAVRAASLAASVSGEDVQRRATAERLRKRLFAR
ncbi:MAG: hypothetical protein ACO1OB_26975 [Archangium sp.]